MMRRLIETDDFPFEFISQLAEQESWRKEIHRPIYHVHKWWAKRLGSVFRGILLGCALPHGSDLQAEFYKQHSFKTLTVFDPFMGAGTTIGEAHKLGLTALGRDINPVAVNAVRVAFGPLNRDTIHKAYIDLSSTVGERIRKLYHSFDSQNRICDVLYYFWVMQATCPECQLPVDLFPSWVIARNAYPDRKPHVQILCPDCGEVFSGLNGEQIVTCGSCQFKFNVEDGPAKGAKANCRNCSRSFVILNAINGNRPNFRLFAKLVLTDALKKEYLRATDLDQTAYSECSKFLKQEEENKRIGLPSLVLEHGFNTRQAISYGFTSWRDFFNDRQLLALGLLRSAINKIADEATRNAFLILFSGLLEFINVFASYKGEGTGAVRHMFSHHILKPERIPIEANVWGTSKSSGSFSNLFRNRLLRTIDYRMAPSEVSGPRRRNKVRVCSPPFVGKVCEWPTGGILSAQAVYLSCGDSSSTQLLEKSVDLVVTDPPFFDNVHYSELADFFHAWQQVPGTNATTRNSNEVQDSNAANFSTKLAMVFTECRRILKDEGLLVFTYHHSRDDGWNALAAAVRSAGFVIVNSLPVKSEMSVAMPKTQAKEPIQLDIIFVCRKSHAFKREHHFPAGQQVSEVATSKLDRLVKAGFKLSTNDRRIVLLGQMLATFDTILNQEVCGSENRVKELSVASY